jgi:hypothetical protein
MGFVSFGVYKLAHLAVGNAISTFIAILAGGLVYVVMIFITRSVTEDELSMFPKGETLVKIYRKALTKGSKDGKM